MFTPTIPTLEAHANSVLRCAAVAAQTAGEQLDGTSRTLVILLMHLVETAGVMGAVRWSASTRAAR
ncbi:DUF3077 domain-containing protein [Pseudomonas sp.]|uniref:DUF3077 domain-containing protein n=1 Tax=Pseudomonas sp. TaxID=306 RepID=UPI0026338418|nr:DUF3077 domain-containing protein [Pseudomonas sp.]